MSDLNNGMNEFENISSEMEGIADLLICLGASLSAAGGGPSRDSLERALNAAANHIIRLSAVVETQGTKLAQP